MVTDRTTESRNGLEAAAALFPEAGCTLLHALDIPYESLWLDARHREDLTRMEMATIQAFAAQARLPADLDRRMRLLVEHGHPESMLRKHALEYDCDTTVIGQFRRGLAFQLLVGGTQPRIEEVSPRGGLGVGDRATGGQDGRAAGGD